MEKKQFDELMKSLKDIQDRLDIIISVQKATMPKPKITVEEKKILKLCDKKHTAEEIATATNKTENNVNVTLSRLRDKGLIRSVEIKDRTVYEKI
jgi:DNA-binding transcriptional ArsR family regulator